ncbi:unnamed protein product, partial [Rotaria sp. Silwood2]
SSSSSIEPSIVNNNNNNNNINIGISVSSSIISNDDISIRQDNYRLNSFLSSNTTNRLSLPNVDYIQQLKREVDKLKRELIHTQESHRQKMEQLKITT